MLAARRVLLQAFGGLVATHVVGCVRSPSREVAVQPQARGAGVPSTLGSRPESDAVHTSPLLDDAIVDGPEQEIRSVEAEPGLNLPPRRSDAETGTEFVKRIEGLGRAASDEEIVAAILSGNVPHHARSLDTIQLLGSSGQAQVQVARDYLAVGSDDDFLRIPMTASAAQRVANAVDASLPTRKIVDSIYAQAPAKLPPCYLDGGPTDDSCEDYLHHQDKVERARVSLGFPLGLLSAGHKKDLVLSKRLTEFPDRVAIYGWHRKEGGVIQPLSTLHSRRYADYSHGIRLVAQSMNVDGVACRLCDVLADPERADLVSDEGPLPIVVYPTTLGAFVPRATPKRRRHKRRPGKKGD